MIFKRQSRPGGAASTLSPKIEGGYGLSLGCSYSQVNASQELLATPRSPRVLPKHLPRQQARKFFPEHSLDVAKQ